MSKALLIIDPQNDFIDHPKKPGSLAVPGSYDDMLRLADYIRQSGPSAIYITMDTHQCYDISHAAWWRDENGKSPKPFTIISSEDIENGKWRTVDETEMEYSKDYVRKLEEQNRYQLCIWPYHVIKGTFGHQVIDVIQSAVQEWEMKNNKRAIYISKGENPRTEHYSGFKAEVELDDDEKTGFNKKLIDELDKFDRIEVAGEALSHCVGNSVKDMMEYISPSKITVLNDCSSSVPGFEKEGEEFLSEFEKMGVEVVDSEKAMDFNKKRLQSYAFLYKSRLGILEDYETSGKTAKSLDMVGEVLSKFPGRALDFEMMINADGSVNLEYEGEKDRLHVCFDFDRGVDFYINIDGEERFDHVKNVKDFNWQIMDDYFKGNLTPQKNNKTSKPAGMGF